MAVGEQLSLMAVFAHPDDESFGVGGTLSRYSREGVGVSLVTATLGEEGEISDPSLATRENLGEVRERELRAACDILGIRELRLLGYRDGSLSAADEREALGKIVGAFRKLRPQVVLTFGPDGVYGHPDHVAISRLATQAYREAGNPSSYPEQLRDGLEPWSPSKLYYLAVPRGRFRQMIEKTLPLLSNSFWSEMDWDSFGVEDDSITSCLRLEGFVGDRLAAILAHRTQVQPNHPFFVIPQAELLGYFSQECYVLADSRAGRPPGMEDDLFWGLR